MGTISEGCHAVVQKVGGEHIRVCTLTRKQGILIEKLRFHADGAFGHPFGLFEVSAGKLTPSSAEKIVNIDGVGDIELQNAEKFTTDVATSSAESEYTCSSSPEDDEFKSPAQKRQKVTQEEIAEMKNNGISAGKLVAKLVDGNVSFAERTTYAQCKYIRRKTRKHSDRVLILKPTVRLLAESYYKRDPDRVLNLRLDLLSQLLTFSGLHSGHRCVVFEQCLGLISAAVLERLGGHGACIHLHKGKIAQAIPCVYSMDFTDEVLLAFLPLPISTLLRGAVESLETQLHEEKTDDVPMMAVDAPITASAPDDSESEAVAARRVERYLREKAAWAVIEEKKVDVLIIAVKGVNPIDILEHLWDSLRAAGTVVLYSPVAEPLLQANRWLMKNNAVNVQLWDFFYRGYQVLPDRTHPLMQQSVAGGLIVSAIKVTTS